MITSEYLLNIKNWFSRYVKTFTQPSEKENPNIILKINHSLRVCDEISLITQSLDLPETQKNLASITALLHDIGRFKQYTRYSTYSDLRSEDHAALGVEIINKYDILKEMSNLEKDYIKKAVYYHNKQHLPEKEPEDILFYIKLIRDADKLDIWQIVTNYYSNKDKTILGTIELGLKDSEGISKKVYKDIMMEKIVDIKSLTNVNDLKCLQLSWIFDINHKKTYSLIKERKYLEKITKVLTNTNDIKKISCKVIRYLENKLEQN